MNVLFFIVPGAFLLALIAGILGIIGTIRTMEARFYDNLASFVTPPDKEHPAPIEQVMEAFSSKLVTSLSASFLGTQGGLTKQARLLENEAKQAYVDGSPVLGALEGMGIKGLAKKNPLLLGLIEQIGAAVASKYLNQAQAKAVTQVPSNGSNNRQFDFKL